MVGVGVFHSHREVGEARFEVIKSEESVVPIESSTDLLRHAENNRKMQLLLALNYRRCPVICGRRVHSYLE